MDGATSVRGCGCCSDSGGFEGLEVLRVNQDNIVDNLYESTDHFAPALQRIYSRRKAACARRSTLRCSNFPCLFSLYEHLSAILVRTTAANKWLMEENLLQYPLFSFDDNLMGLGPVVWRARVFRDCN